MFNGFTSPKKSDIFGPSGAGGSWADVRNGNLYQHGEGGLSSFVGNLFRKIAPLAKSSLKKTIKSNILKEAGKQLLDSSINGAVNVTSDLLSGDKNFKESASQQLDQAKLDIANSLRKANRKRKRKSDDDYVVHSAIKPRKKSNISPKKKKKKKKTVQNSVLSEDEFE